MFPFLPCPSRRLLAVVAALMAALLGLGATSCTPRPSLGQLEHKLYATSLPSFQDWWRVEQARAQHVSLATIDRWLASTPAALDRPAARSRPWDVSTDLCSFAPNRGPVFDFRVPCIRHDFAWRNLRRLSRTTPGVDTRARRLAANRQFLRDMQWTCSRRHVTQRPACGALARTYYGAVSAAT
jgi:hypothetical protein